MKEHKETWKILAGKNLKRLIREKYSSQAQFAFEVYGTDVRTINRYVNNGVDSLTTLQQLAEHFNVGIEEFLRDDI